jgi:uncharacterized membrane protein YbhN (UPF0104 family)
MSSAAAASAPPIADVPAPSWRHRRRTVMLAAPALVVGVAGIAASGVANIGQRLAAPRPAWIILAGGLELASALGFVAIFQLAFGEWLPRRTSMRTGLTVLAATILVPAGGLVAIAIGARALRSRGMSATKTRSRAIALLIITNAPNLIVMGVVGVALAAGALDGPHAPLLTIVPAAIAFGVIGVTAAIPTVSHQRAAPVSLTIIRRAVSATGTQLELGVLEAGALLSRRSWKLLGAALYYAADNAVLWAMFRAFGHAHPPITTLAMAYLIGSAAGSLPVPGGIGVVEGGMIGALVLYGAPAACAGVAVLAYRAVSTGLPLALGGVGVLALCRPGRSSVRAEEGLKRRFERHGR